MMDGAFVAAIAIFFTWLITGLIFQGGEHYTTGEVIADCEAELPRDKHCILVAVPAQEVE
jgi:hypothetical protein